MVYGISIVMLIASHIKRRHAKILEDKQIDKYLQDFQIIKEKQDREKYRQMKRRITAKLHFQRAMKRRTYKTIQKSCLPAIVVGVPSRSHERLDSAVGSAEDSSRLGDDKKFLRVSSFRSSMRRSQNGHEQIRHSRSMSLRALIKRSTSLRSSFRGGSAVLRKTSAHSMGCPTRKISNVSCNNNAPSNSTKSINSRSSTGSKCSIASSTHHNHRCSSTSSVMKPSLQDSPATPETATTSAGQTPDRPLPPSTLTIPNILEVDCHLDSDQGIVVTPLVHVSPPHMDDDVFTTKEIPRFLSDNNSDTDISLGDVARRLSDLSNDVFSCTTHLNVSGRASCNSTQSAGSVRDWYTSDHDSATSCEEPLINVTCL